MAVVNPDVAPGAGAGLSFEEALDQLGKVVEAMESGELPLEELLKQFEQGAVLVQTCQARLSAADRRVKLLEKTLDGLQARPLDELQSD